MLYSKEIPERFGALTVMAWIFGIATLLFLPIGALDVATKAPNWSAGAVWLVAYIVLAPTILVYAANAWALRYASPGQVTIHMFSQPVIVVLLAWTRLGQELSIQTLYAAILTTLGVALVLTAKQAKAK
uniref:EamA-like transporter family protein n=1 Tax=Candidatus Kentrum sp. TC TaxID=2126339 RepID=A0A450YT19_9GAMM|nr:MAG: EamA-like transporter family protein [Candidatus Kentron sp. TC]